MREYSFFEMLVKNIRTRLNCYVNLTFKLIITYLK